MRLDGGLGGVQTVHDLTLQPGRLLSITSALSTLCTRPRRVRAASKAIRAVRSISNSLYIVVSQARIPAPAHCGACDSALPGLLAKVQPQQAGIVEFIVPHNAWPENRQTRIGRPHASLALCIYATRGRRRLLPVEAWSAVCAIQ
jgi:hypothetical protein